MNTDQGNLTSRADLAPTVRAELPRELMEACCAVSQEATFQGFADSVLKDKITRLHETVYRMGFESGWRVHEKQISFARVKEALSERRISAALDALNKLDSGLWSRGGVSNRELITAIVEALNGSPE